MIYKYKRLLCLLLYILLLINMPIIAKYKLNWNANDSLWVNNWTTGWTVSYNDAKSWQGFNDSSNGFIQINTGLFDANWTYTISMIAMRRQINLVNNRNEAYSKDDSSWRWLIITNYWWANRICFWLYDTAWKQANSAADKQNNVYYHVVAIKNWTTASLWVNWKLEATVPVGVIINWTTRHNIWRYYSNPAPTGWMDWKIDEVEFNSTAYSAAQVKNQYAFYYWFM